MNQDSTRQHKLIIRSWPKMIFLWPTAAVSLIAGTVGMFTDGWGEIFGHIFVVCFFLNLAVLTFDFPRSTSLTIFITVITVVLGVVLLNQKFGVIEPLQKWLAALDVNASAEFYFAIFISMLILYFGMAIVTRFDYWELTSNELIHHTGLLGDVERFSTAGLKLNTELNDVFEYILAGAGRIIINIPGQQRPYVLDNVLRIKSILNVSKELLSRRVVEVSGGDTSRGQSADDQQKTAAEYE
jgi:hypothetical protein